jgi:glutaconate CoA-transferase subunit A
VALAPGGARPSYALGISERDNEAYREWDGISRNREVFVNWMEANVLGAGS